MPAFFNGVFGHKASPGMVSNSGQFPTTDTDAGNLLLASGPICRYAVDLTLLLKVIYPACQLMPVVVVLSSIDLNFKCTGHA